MPRLSALPAGVALLVAACSDATAPTFTGSLKLEQSSPPVAEADARVLKRDAVAPPLLTLDTAVWVVRGERQTIRIRHQQTGSVPDSLLELLKLDFHEWTLQAGPDGTPIAEGDSVLVTVRVDPATWRWSLEPGGLVFDRPALLRVRYNFADPDLNEDGVVDQRDEGIRVGGIWLRRLADGLWGALPAEHDLTERKFTAEIDHFSNYALAW